MPDQKTPAQKKPPVMPVIDGLTPAKWNAAMSRKPDGVSKKDWSVLTTTLFEIQAGRTIQKSQLDYAKKVAVAGKATPAMQKLLDDAETNRLTLAATESGSKQIAAQPPLEFQSATAKAPAAKPAVAAAHPASAAPHVVVTASTPTRPHAVARPAALASHRPPVARPAAAAAPVVVKIPPGLPADQAASYRQLVAAVRAGKSQGISYGKLNFAYETADRADDWENRDIILGQMHKLRPLVTRPGKAGFRYGVNDAEYANYAKVENALKAGQGASVPEKNLVLAHKTAVKYGHTEQADAIAALLPSGGKVPIVVAAKGKPAAPAPHAAHAAHTRPTHAAAKVATVAAPAAGAAAVAATVAAKKSSGPSKPESVSDQDWTTFKSVLDQLGKGVVPPTKDLQTASRVSTEMQSAGMKFPLTNSMIFHVLALGDAATVKQLAEVRRLSIAEKKPDAVVKIFNQRLIMAAIKSNSPADMKVAEQVARTSGQTKTADAFAQKLKSFSPAAGGTAPAPTAATLAMAKPAPQRPTRQGAPAPSVGRPKAIAQAPAAPKGYTAADSKAVDEGLKKLDRYEKEALLNASHKMAAKQPLTLKELTEAQAAADKAGLTAPAVKFGRAASELHQKMAAADAAKRAAGAPKVAAAPPKAPPPPTVVAKVPVVPPPAVVAVQSEKLGVHPADTDDLIKTAKSNTAAAKDAQKTIAEGAKTAQGAAAGNPADQKKISDLQAEAEKPGPEGVEAQKKLAGIAASNSITITVAQPNAAPGAAPAPQQSFTPPEGRGEPLPPPLVSEADVGPRPTPVTSRGPAFRRPAPVDDAGPGAADIPPPPPPTPEEVANPGDTPVSSKYVKGAAVALGVGAAAGGAAGVILSAKKNDEGAKNNMRAGAALVDDLDSEDPQTKSTAQETLAGIKARDKAGDPAARKQLEGVAAAAATKKAMEDKKKADKAKVLKDIRSGMVLASVAGPPSDNPVPAVLGALALAGGGLFLAIRGKKKAA